MSDNYKEIISEPLTIDELPGLTSYGLTAIELYDKYISNDKRINDLLSTGMLLGEINANFNNHVEFNTIHLASTIIKIDRIYKVGDQVVVDYKYLNEKDYKLLKDRKHKLIPRVMKRLVDGKIVNVRLVTIDMKTV